MSDDPARMHRFSLRFADPELEASFAEDQARKSQRTVRMGALWTGGIVLVLWALIGVTFPQIPDVHARFAVPMIVTLGILALSYALFTTPRFLRFHQLIIMTAMCVMAAVVVGGVSLMPPATMASVGIVLVVIHTYNTYALVRLRFPTASFCAWLTVPMYLGYVGAIGAVTGYAFWSQAVTLGVANAFGMLVCYQLDLHVRREYLAVRELERAELELRLARDQAVAATLAKRVPGQHEPRIAHAAECDQRLFRGADRAHVRRTEREAG